MDFLKSQLGLFSLFSVVNLRHYWWYYFFICLGIVFSISIISFFQIMGQPSEITNLLKWGYWFFLNIGIVNITASGFSVYRDKNTRIHLLTLPVSNGMRLFTLVFYTIIVPAILVTIIYTLTANAIAFFCKINDFTDSFSFNPFLQPGYFKNLILYIIFQSLLLMIGSFFLRVGIIKTIISLICIILIILIIDSITASYSVDKSIFWNMFSIFTNGQSSSKEILDQLPKLLIFTKNILGIMLIPLSYYIVFLRIKELEV